MLQRKDAPAVFNKTAHYQHPDVLLILEMLFPEGSGRPQPKPSLPSPDGGP